MTAVRDSPGTPGVARMLLRARVITLRARSWLGRRRTPCGVSLSQSLLLSRPAHRKTQFTMQAWATARATATAEVALAGPGLQARVARSRRAKMARRITRAPRRRQTR